MENNPPQSNVIFRGDSSRCILGERIAVGGEAVIYEIGTDDRRVAKLYHKIDDARRDKLHAMLKAVPKDPQRVPTGHVSICWPEEVIYNQREQVIGCILPKLDTVTHHPVALFWNPEDRAEHFPGFTWQYLIGAAANISSVVQLVHEQGHVIGDLNEENFLVNNRSLATLVDCDSMQIRDPHSGKVFRSALAREPYISPEAMGKQLSAHDRSPYDDYWALAVLVFQVLMEGQHPSNGRGIPEERSLRIKEGLFPFLGQSGFEIPTYALTFSILPEALRDLFTRCFREGHLNPAARPSAAQWRAELLSLSRSLSRCAQVGLHWYSNHLSRCPWCEQANAFGIDRFSDSAVEQSALPPLTPQARAGTQYPLSTWNRHSSELFSLSAPPEFLSGPDMDVFPVKQINLVAYKLEGPDVPLCLLQSAFSTYAHDPSFGSEAGYKDFVRALEKEVGGLKTISKVTGQLPSGRTARYVLEAHSDVGVRETYDVTCIYGQYCGGIVSFALMEFDDPNVTVKQFPQVTYQQCKKMFDQVIDSVQVHDCPAMLSHIRPLFSVAAPREWSIYEKNELVIRLEPLHGPRDGTVRIQAYVLEISTSIQVGAFLTDPFEVFLQSFKNAFKESWPLGIIVHEKVESKNSRVAKRIYRGTIPRKGLPALKFELACFRYSKHFAHVAWWAPERDLNLYHAVFQKIADSLTIKDNVD